MEVKISLNKKGVKQKMKRILLLICLAFVLVLAGCAGSSPTSSPDSGKDPASLSKGVLAVIFSDQFNTYDTSVWASVKGAPRVSNGRLILESTPQNGCDCTSIASYLNKQLELKTPSLNWAVDTSIGFETWTPSHCGIVVTAGTLGIINHQLAGGIPDQEAYIAIPNWSSLKSGDNVYQIKWTSGKVELYINGTFSCSYTGNKVPTVKCNIRMNASNDYYDNLQVDYVTVQ
jgi:hypothetical protein